MMTFRAVRRSKIFGNNIAVGNQYMQIRQQHSEQSKTCLFTECVDASASLGRHRENPSRNIEKLTLILVAKFATNAPLRYIHYKLLIDNRLYYISLLCNLECTSVASGVHSKLK